MKNLLLVITAVLALAFSTLGCSPTQTSPPKTDKSNVPQYTADQVISKAIARGTVGQDSHVEWVWTAEYLPAQPDLKLKGVWKLEQTGVDADNHKVNQVWYFHEDTGTFTYTR